MERGGLGQQLVDGAVRVGDEAGAREPPGERQRHKRQEKSPEVTERQPCDAEDKGRHDERGVFATGESQPEPRGQRAFVRRAIGVDVAQIVHREQDARMQSDLQSGQHGGRR